MKKIRVALLIDEMFGGAGTAFGGYGFLARKYIAGYIPDEKIEIDVLLEMTEAVNEVTAEKVDNVTVYRFPKNDEIVKEWLTKQNYDVFLSIELTWPSHEILKFIPNDRKLVLWIQDPRPKSAWDNIIDSMQSIKDPCFYHQPVYDLVHELTEKGQVKYISQGYTLNPLAKELYDLPENTPIQYLPNPVEIDYDFQFDAGKKKNKVIFLGRLEAQKRAWLFCEVAKRMPEYEFYVLGKFFRHQEDNRRMVEPYMKEDIQNLHFMGHVDGAEKAELIKEAKILLNTSIWEGIPISWLECLSFGTVVVSCLDNEHLSSKYGRFVGEILGDGFEQVDKFIPAIRELMENEEEYKKLAAEGMAYIRQDHGIKRFQKSLRKVLVKESNNSDLVWRRRRAELRNLLWREEEIGEARFFKLCGLPVAKILKKKKNEMLYVLGIQVKKLMLKEENY